jgi:hypothetical protein
MPPTHPLYKYMKKASTIIVMGPPYSFSAHANAATKLSIAADAHSSVALGRARLLGTGISAEPQKPPSWKVTACQQQQGKDAETAGLNVLAAHALNSSESMVSRMCCQCC